MIYIFPSIKGIFATNSNVLIPISLKPDGLTFDKTEFIIKNI